MASVLATIDTGNSGAAILFPSNETRIYYQGAEGGIHEAEGTGPATSNPGYLYRLVVSPSGVRANSPIAAITWTDKNQREQVCLYFVDQANILRESVGISSSSAFNDGALSGMKYQVQPGSTLLYAIVASVDLENNTASLRVGFQATDAPSVITEAYYDGSKWERGTFA